ncbi:RDD family protein [Suttonella sp. R2A3]|uniref:RDD family protein n=1 Tax=Suttonella sp. R2A3 TaxID=2908648 RepID=UPI001F2198E6|nr:RDD family protein [Suttonella sp. R2A3]UJF23910.1 RDD family protein [Suttonella sp. R2A3]
MSAKPIEVSAKPPSVLRILAAMFYDGFLVLACIMVFGFAMVAINSVMVGELHEIEPQSLMGYLLSFGMLVISALFFTYFWSRQSQTLGMRAWRLIVVNEQGQSPTLTQAFMRWIYALITLLPAGLGLWWRWFDTDRRSLYDRLSRTRLYRLNRNPYPKTQ